MLKLELLIVFKEGKKISMFRDPVTWIWALAKFRFQRL